MNCKKTILSVLVGAVALLVALQYGYAASSAPAGAAPAAAAPKIGVVSIRGVFDGSKKHTLYQAQTTKRMTQVRNEIEQLSRQLDREEGDLKTTLKPGTDDYVKQYQVVLELRSKLQNQQELLKQQRMAEDKKWFEALYQETLKSIEALAKEKGLDVVLERTEPKFPIASEEVTSLLISNKVLYSGGCVDLTNDVIARVDASTTLQP